LVTHQLTEYHAQFATEQRQILPSLDIPLFSLLQRRLPHAALKKLGSELRRSRRRDFPEACLCIVRRVMGLPCGHELARWLRQNVPVPLTAIHRHWCFDVELEEDEGSEILPIHDPLPQRRTRNTEATEVTR
jgi:hypothetical protein